MTRAFVAPQAPRSSNAFSALRWLTLYSRRYWHESWHHLRCGSHPARETPGVTRTFRAECARSSEQPDENGYDADSGHHHRTEPQCHSVLGVGKPSVESGGDLGQPRIEMPLGVRKPVLDGHEAGLHGDEPRIHARFELA
jgi:hypothetical protein